MKKRLLAILVMAIVMILAFTSCEYVDMAKDFIKDAIDQIIPPEEQPPVDPELEEYVVYFLAGSGTSVPNQTVTEGGLVTKPEDPYKEGYLFGGWYKDDAHTEEWNFDTDKVEKNTILYGKWNEHTHTGGTATCTEKAICEVCGHAYGSLLAHVGGSATCTEQAECEVCGNAYGALLDHVGGEATCTTQAECEVCGTPYGSPLGHNVALIPGTAPTCTEDGLTDGAYCTRCDAKAEQEVIPALGHVDEDEDYVCDRCDAELERPAIITTTVLEPTEGTPFQGPQIVRLGNFEIILSSEKSRIESKSATFELPDGTFETKGFRINFNGSETLYDAETGKWQNAIWFVTSGKGTVTIYWQHAGKGSTGDTSTKAYRNVALWNAAGEMLASTNEQYDYEAFIVTTFEFDEAGTYYIGNLAGANNFFYVEVSYEGELAELPDLVKYPVHFATGEGSAIDSIEVAENGTVEKPADPTREGYDFSGWYKDEECTTPWNFTTDKVTEETTLFAKWEEVYTGEYEDVTYSLNISDLETGTRSADEINGYFTIVSGSEVRNRTKTYDGVEYQKSVKIGNSTTKILVNVPGTGKLSFLVQNGSSGAATQFITVTAPDGTVHNIEFVGADGGSPLVMVELDVTEGLWTISRGKNGGTQDIFALELSCSVEVSPENGFKLVAPGTVDYIAGQDLDVSKLVLNATFANGKTEPLTLADVTVDSSAFNKDVAGEYTITVSYKDYAPISYTVTVYAPSAIELHFDAVEKLSQNSQAGNGVYYNYSWKEVYFVGDELTTDGLSVYVVASFGEKTLKFRVEDYEITGFDSSFADYCVLTVSAYGVSTEIEIHVTDTNPTANENGVYQLLVDPDYEGLAGAISGPYHVFSTIQGALDYAEKIEKSAVKELYIASGVYNEKIEITLPNLHIIGMGQSADDVVIEWDSLYGLVDGGGFTHTTDSTQTVAVRDSAVNVTIENVTISNYWNTQERMDAAGLAIERGLALLVQADRFVMKNSKLLGIQDTLELFTGRQYFENVFISGYTDFIFGTNNTTYFKNCTVHVIDTVKDDQGTAGYITAFKGSNKGADDAIVYGAIFDGCKFTADAGVMAGKTAIGRTWGAYAAVAVINSELGGHISLDGYVSSENKNKRYISMNGIHPTDSTVQFVEYGNTGAGAITEAVAGMRMLSAEEAAIYASFATIFGTTNGKITYLDPWDPTSAEVVVDDREYYYFNGQEGTSGTSYTYTDNIQGTTGTLGNLVIDATVGKLTHRGSDSQFNAGAKIIFNVEAGTLVTVISYPGYGYYTINGIAHNANDTFSVYFAEATEVVIESTSTSYIYQLIINPNEAAPEAPALNEIKVEGMQKDYVVGDELSLEGVVVKAYYSDYSVVVVSDYTVDTTAVNNAAAGEYDVVFSFGGKTVTVKVTFEGENADPRKDVNMTFGSAGNWVDGDPAIDLSGITVNNNGGNNSQVKEGSIRITLYAGATLTIKGYSGYTDYTLSDGTIEYVINKDSADHTAHVYTAEADVVVTITVTSGNNYFYGIEIKYPAAPVYVEGEITFGSEGNYKEFKGLEASTANFRDNGGNNTQFSAGSISFLVKEGATVTIHGYPGYTSYSVNGGSEITEEYYTYVATADTTLVISAVNGNNYFYSITVSVPVVEVTHTFDAGVLADAAKESKADGETEVVGDFFTIHYGKNSVVEANAKTFEDGFVSTKRFTLGGKATPGTEGKCCVEFTVSGKSTVKIWWISGGDGRQMTIFGADGSALQKTEVSVKNALYIVEFTVEAGTYFIGGDTGSNYIYQIVVSPYVAPAHECEHVCEECGKCTDAECGESVCAEKCEGHTPVDLTPVVGEWLKYAGNDCYTFDSENYLEEITFTYENVSTNTYQNVNAWIKDKAAGKATLQLYLVNNGTETVYVTVKLEAAGAVALAEEKVYVAAGEVKEVTLNFVGEAEMLYFFIDTGWSETTTSHSGSLTVAGVRFSGEAGSVTPPADTGLQLNFWTSSSDYTTNGNNIKYSGAGNSYSCAGSDVAALAAGKNTFTVTITNNGTETSRVRIDIQGTTQVGNHTVLNTSATGGDVWTDAEWGGSTVTVAPGESVTLVIVYDEYTERGAVTNLVVFVDSGRGDDATYNSDVTLSEMAFSGESTPPAAETVTYVLDASTDIAAFAKESKADGDSEVINDFFKLHYGKSSVVESNSKTFADGYTSTQRFTLGGKTQIGSTTKCCVEFTVTGKTTVKIWWISGGDGRQMTIFGTDKAVVCATTESVKNALYYTEFEIEAGTYYLGGDTGSNYIYKLEMVVSQ